MRKLNLVGSVTALLGALLLVAAPAVASPLPVPTIKERLAGADRFATAVAVSQSAYPSTAPVVYVANGLNFPDALSAGPVAAKQDGPLLLTLPGGVRSDVKAEISRLHPARIVIVGGTSAVSPAVETTLKAIAPVTRIAGDDRFATSQQLASSAFPHTAPTVYLATGRNFPDALSAGAAAAAAGGPVLLINGEADRLDPETVSLLSKLAPSTVNLVGGKAALSDGILGQTSQLMPTATVTRIAGDDRFATSAKVALSVGTATHAYVTSGENFPDALVGSALAGKHHLPLYVIRSWCQDDAITVSQAALGVTEVSLLGGPNAIQTSATTTACPGGGMFLP